MATLSCGSVAAQAMGMARARGHFASFRARLIAIV